MTLFNACHHFHLGPAGGMSINLAHLPHPGGILDQGAKVLASFDAIKKAIYDREASKIKARIK